ncbi:hypothetical protein N9R79_09770 [Vibrio sp.]|nr:hypothetical protein [Vibrio sp.]
MDKAVIIVSLNWAVVIFGLLAAFFWCWSAIVKVRNVKQELNPDISFINGKGTNF